MDPSGKVCQNVHKSASLIHEDLHDKGVAVLAISVVVTAERMWISPTASP